MPSQCKWQDQGRERTGGGRSRADGMTRYRRGMLDLRQLRAEPDTVKAAVARRGEPTAPLDQVIIHDERRRAVVSEADELRAEVKRISAEVGALHRAGRAGEADELRVRSRELGAPRRRAGRGGRAALGVDPPDPAVRAQHARRGLPRRVGTRRQRRRVQRSTTTPAPMASISGRRTGSWARSSASSISTGRCACRERCSPCTAGWGPGWCGASSNTGLTATGTCTRRSGRPPWSEPRP